MLQKLFSIVLLSSIVYGCSTCERVVLSNSTNFFTIDEGWNYNPEDFRNNRSVCKDNKEYFYSKVQSKLSYVALKTLHKRNQDNIEASCKNNALFTGKPILFKKMLRSVASSKSSDEALRDIADKNQTKDKAGILECRSLPSSLGTEPFLECECVLYAYYPGGEKKLSKE